MTDKTEEELLKGKGLGFEKIKDLVEGELGDYSFFEIGDIELYDEYGDEEYYRVNIKAERTSIPKLTNRIICFKYDTQNEDIYVELGEDNYEKVEDFDWTIKYFWMALLEW